MSLYARLTAALGTPYGSEPVAQLLAGLPPKKGLTKPGAYQASLTFKKHGIYLIFAWQRPEWLMTSAILFPGGVEGFHAFPDQVEGRLTIACDRAAVRNTLGLPSQSGGGGPQILAVLTDYPWDRYDLHSYSLRFDYLSAEGPVRIASLMTAELAAQLNPSLRQGKVGAG
jgi:hypothetical protein